MQRSALPRATAMDHPPAVRCLAAGVDTGGSATLTAGNADLYLVTCDLPRGRSLGTTPVVEVFR
jgi:hypothetical protein